MKQCAKITAKVFILVIAGIFCNSANAVYSHEEPPKTPSEKKTAEKKRLRIMQNGINKATCFKLAVENGQIMQEKKKYYEIAYDSTGCITELSEFENDTLTARTKHCYDFNFNLVVDFDLDADLMQQGFGVFQYSDDGLIINVIEYGAGYCPEALMTYTYQPEKRCILFTKYISGGTVEYTIEYMYDADIRKSDCIEIIKKDAGGRQIISVENIYDKTGNRTEKKIYNDKDSLDYKFVYTYTADKDFLKIKKVSASGELISEDHYEYFPDNMVRSVTKTDQHGSVLSAIVFEYEKSSK